MQFIAAARLTPVGRPRPRQGSWFTRGRPVDGLYPDGYDLPQLGPTTQQADWR